MTGPANNAQQQKFQLKMIKGNFEQDHQHLKNTIGLIAAGRIQQNIGLNRVGL